MRFRELLLIAALTPMTLANTAHAQLRPLDPTDYAAFSGAPVRVSLGGAFYNDQRASLAGTEGRLWELGNARVLIRTGRVLLDFGGTVQRLFTNESVWAPPVGDAVPPSTDRRRHDAGDYRAGVVVRLTGQSPTLVTLRFGTRLPTTDNLVGLDRDATDFFATLGAQRRVARFDVAGEAGVGINGTRTTTHEQSDVLIYAAQAQLPLRRLTPYFVALGQEDLHPAGIRGNEDLGEVRVGVRAGARRWVDVAFVHGYREFSPSTGVQLTLGASFGR